MQAAFIEKYLFYPLATLHDMDEDKIPKGFEEYKYGIPGYDNSNAMLRYLCRPCVKRKGCRINREIRDAMGENYPYWNDAFVIATRQLHIPRFEIEDGDDFTVLRPRDVPDYVDGFPSSVDEIIVCKKYEDPQLEFKF
jgi:hypothetical protein